jgi:NAD+ kinase
LLPGRPNGLDAGDVPEGCQLVISLGGDGTLLGAARAIGERDVLLLGVNLGRLGFLSAFSAEELFDELNGVLEGSYLISERKLLRARVMRGSEEVGNYVALNDAVVTNSSLARMVEFDLRVDDSFMCGYKADGLIISTPTGSTAYSLSAGGPIVYPAVSCLCLTAIAPHVLANRPVIVPDTSRLEIVMTSRNDSVQFTVDGQVGIQLQPSDRILCAAAKHTLKMVAPPKMRFFDVLRDKLKWGTD